MAGTQIARGKVADNFRGVAGGQDAGQARLRVNFKNFGFYSR